MNTGIKLLLITAITAAFVPIYYLIAKKLRLVDNPNERSSHASPTLRGAGILFLVAYYCGQLIFDAQPMWLNLGLLIGAITGFVDDKIQLRPVTRGLLYGLALLLCFISAIEVTNLTLTLPIVLGYIVALGTVNAYNFMDGINGITTVYTAVFVLSTILFTTFELFIIDINPSQFLLVGCVVFGVLNFRKNALAFMGDVGSVFVGMLVVYILISVIGSTSNIVYLGFLMVYGVDTTFTIVERIIKKENIFDAHRSHLYQLISNELGCSQLHVSVYYGLTQLLINGLIYLAIINLWDGWLTFILLSIFCGAIYFIIKYHLVNKKINLKSKHV